MDVAGQTLDLMRETNGDMTLELEWQVIDAGSSAVLLGLGSADNRFEVDISDRVQALAGTGWQFSRVKLSCFGDQGAVMDQVNAPLVIRSEGPLKLQIATARIVANPGDASCEP